MTKTKVVVSALTLGVASLFSGVASADYVCSVNWKHYGGSTLGQAGHIVITAYTQPACAGSLIGTKYICSTGATSSNCANSAFLRTEAQVMTEVPLLRAAAEADQRIGFSTSTCVGGSGSCPVSVYYYSE